MLQNARTLHTYTHHARARTCKREHIDIEIYCYKKLTFFLTYFNKKLIISILNY